MVILSQVRVRVHDAERAASFFGSVFAWELRHAQRATGRETTVLTLRTAGPAQPPAVQLVFSDDPAEPMVRLSFATVNIARVSEHVEHLGGRIERNDPSGTRCLDSEGTPLLLRGARDNQAGQPGPAARGVLGVIFVSVPDPEPVIEAISEHTGRVGPPAGAGIFTTGACSDDQGTPFSLWYPAQPQSLEQRPPPTSTGATPP